ncbi:hypothetical protein [Streptomyces sp. NPDC003023]|uniref:hypothetical protein n=1 Tax=Streptomyces sp. NPDC003023 TaxID=3364675 RepID=UPI00369739DE
MTTTSATLPPVTAEVAAGALELLPGRLRKRVDAAMAKVPGWAVEPLPDGVRVRVDADTAVDLRVTEGVVVRPQDAVCGCLLAPACLHRAAVLSSAPLAVTEPADEPAPEEPQEPEVPREPQEPYGPTGSRDRSQPTGSAGTTGPAEPAELTQPAPPAQHAQPSDGSGSTALDTSRHTAVHALWRAATAVLVAGSSGAGAVQRAELLHAAHSARLAGLHLPAAGAVRIARRLGEARSGDPSFRLAELTAELTALLDVLLHPADAVTPARRAYRPAEPLRLYGLFTEPVVTASGYAGATAYGLAADGRLRTVSDITPGGPERALRAAGSPVPGGCALPLREWGDGGAVILTGPTVSADGRIGGGKGLRSVRAAGAGWHEPPLDALWQRSPSEQLASALARSVQPAEERPAGSDLLFLTGTLVPGGFAVSGGPVLRLLAPDERPELPYAENLRLLGSCPGLALRLIARLVPDRPDGVLALAAGWTGHDAQPVRADLGLRRLNRSDIPAVPCSAETTAGAETAAASPPALPLELSLLRRAVDRTVAGGRPVTAAAADGELPRRLRAVGLSTGADLARDLARTAADRRHDALGRLLPADPDAFATAWLAASVYVSAAAGSLLTAAWSPAGPDASHTRSGPTVSQP